MAAHSPWSSEIGAATPDDPIARPVSVDARPLRRISSSSAQPEIVAFVTSLRTSASLFRGDELLKVRFAIEIAIGTQRPRRGRQA